MRVPEEYFDSVEEHLGHKVGDKVDWFMPMFGNTGVEIVGTLRAILLDKEIGTVWYRVENEAGEVNDFLGNDIITPQDVMKDPHEIEVNVVCSDPEATVPQYATQGSSGFDFVSLENVVLSPLHPEVVRTGLKFEIPEGFELQIRGRSSLGKKGITIANGVGTIDSDYRGEIGVVLVNLSAMERVILKGDRIAQGVIVPVMRAVFNKVDVISNTERGEGGFGSTGK